MGPSGSKGVCLDFSRLSSTHSNGCPTALVYIYLDLVIPDILD